MSTDLHDLLDRGVDPRPTDVDGDALVTRGLRRRATKRAAGGAAAALVLLGGITGITSLVTQPDLPIVGEAPGDDLGWERIEDAPLTPREEPVTAVDGDRILFWGGDTGAPHADVSDGGTEHGSVELQDGAVYDRAQDGWTPVPVAPSLSLRTGPAVALRGDTALVWGGLSLQPVGSGQILGEDSRPLLDGAVYDLRSGTWTRIPDAPFSPRIPAAVDWDGEQLLVWGGDALDGTHPADGARWTAADGWQPMASFPLAPRLGPAVAWDEDRLVVWGGGTNLDPAEGEEELVADGAVYDRDTDAWTVVEPGPLSPRWFSYGRSTQTALLDGDRVLIAGGSTTTPLEQHRDGAWLDLGAGTWQPIAPAPAEARFATTDAAGAVAFDDTDGTAWLYDTVEDRWDRIATGRQIADSRPAPWGRVAHERVGAPDGDGVWRPVGVLDPAGVARRPALEDVRGSDARSFHVVVPIDSGVVLWGGMTQQMDGGTVTDADWTATGWFLRAP